MGSAGCWGRLFSGGAKKLDVSKDLCDGSHQGRKVIVALISVLVRHRLHNQLQLVKFVVCRELSNLCKFCSVELFGVSLVVLDCPSDPPNRRSHDRLT